MVDVDVPLRDVPDLLAHKDLGMLWSATAPKD
jgi:hypothetical protein